MALRVLAKLNQVTRCLGSEYLGSLSKHTTSPSRCLSSEALAAMYNKTPRTKIEDPEQHTTDQIGKFYSVPEVDYNEVVSCFLKAEHRRLLKSFEDRSLMIRAPSLEVINYLKKVNFENPVIPFVLFGARGAGTSAAMAHVAHYARRRGWLIVNFAESYKWLRYSPDLVFSSRSPGMYELPTHAANWLRSFATMNAQLLKEKEPKTSREIQWNLKESASVGTPWTEVVNFGLSRQKYSTDCVGILLREIRHQASEIPLRTLVCIDGVNFLWSEETLLRDPNTHELITVDKLALVRFMRDLVSPTWTNGALLTSVGQKAAWTKRRDNYMPRYLLTDEGFSWMEPFLPVEVGPYTAQEVDSCLRYYAEHNWITNPAALDPNQSGRKEITFLADNNPQELFDVVAEW